MFLNPNDMRDDLSSLFNHDPISHPHVLTADLVEVV
jgi:hypothetical protein